MPAPISVLIPTLEAAHTIGPTLGALTEALEAGLLAEVILADGGSTDGIATVAEACGVRLIRASRGRGSQLAHGAEVARGTWLLVLHADCVLTPGWTKAVQAHMARCGDKAGWFTLRFDGTGLAPGLVAGWANLRARAFGLPYGDQGLLIRKDVYRAAGGYPAIPLMEDVALARALGRRRLAPIRHAVITSAARYRRDGWLRRGARNLSTLAAYLAGRDPVDLARRYERSGQSDRTGPG